MPSNPQLRKMYATARELGIDNELLHSLVFNLTGIQHISALTTREAILVIDELDKRKGIKPQTNKNPNRISPEQIWKVRDLEKKLGWDENPKRLKGFIRKYAKVDVLDWLNPWQASNVIEGMKNLFEHNKIAQ